MPKNGVENPKQADKRQMVIRRTIRTNEHENIFFSFLNLDFHTKLTSASDAHISVRVAYFVLEFYYFDLQTEINHHAKIHAPESVGFANLNNA